MLVFFNILSHCKSKIICIFFVCFREPTAAEVSGGQEKGWVFQFYRL